MTVSPATLPALVEAVRAAPRVLAVGGGTKPALSAHQDDTVRLSTLQLRGLTAYEPAEYTFTALAGTPMREIIHELASRGQRLPFDPMLAEAGATLGGTVAAGLSGPGRLRFGGIRDFILGVGFVDGLGRFLRLGGRVVKNAAGFDLPKFLVGSAGRFAVLGEFTFKVFPMPAATLTLQLSVADVPHLVRLLVQTIRQRWELEALEADPAAGHVLARLAGPPEAIAALARDVLASHSGRLLDSTEAAAHWRDLLEFTWAPSAHALVKIPLSPREIPFICDLASRLPAAHLRIGAAGNVAWLALPPAELHSLHRALTTASRSAWVLRGPPPLRLGLDSDFIIAASVRHALDPEGRFPPFTETFPDAARHQPR